MTLDVVLVAHNSAAHLGDALAALPDDADVVVVDNASSDDSVAIAESCGATVIAGQTNAGFAAACNRGAAVGTAKLVLFLNPDAVIESLALERLTEALDDPSVGVAAPRLTHPDGTRQKVQWPYPNPRDAWEEALGVHRVRLAEPDRGFVIGACFLVRRHAFEPVGGFDERFWLYGEETDLCRRIEDAGWSVVRVANAMATHIGGAASDGPEGRPALVAEHFDRGSELYVHKYHGARGLVSFRAANLVGSMLRGGLGLGARSSLHRRRARRLLGALATRPATVELNSPATAAPGKGLVVLSLEAWDEVWRRNQFFVRELLEIDPDLRVLFVEPAFDVAHERRRHSTRRRARGLRPVDADGRIVRFEPVKWLPRRLGASADDLRDSQVLDAAARLGLVRPRLWVNDPSYATLADRVDWPAVYDITDDWTQVADTTAAAKARANEERLFERCEAVTVCSRGLLESRKSIRGDLVLIPNAVDFQHLITARPRPDDLPAGTCAVYVGTLHTDRLDVDLVCELARDAPELDVVLVGPDALDGRSRSELDAAGVIRLGARPYEDVPGYLQHADVVIVPHVVTPFTESLDPIKAYECVAVGVPTVATPVSGFRGLGPPVRVTEAGAFVAAVRQVVAAPPAVTPRTGDTWAARAEKFHEVLDAAVSTARVRRHSASPPHALTADPPTFKPRRLSRRRGATRRLVINARFRQRPVTGVERYATELTSRLPEGIPLLGPTPRLARPPLGHLWEQTGLPIEVGPNDLLWSPCNTGPAFLRNHLVTIHDVSPLEHPEWFAPNYRRWIQPLTCTLARNAEHILVPSQFTRDRLMAVCGTDESKITVIANGVGTSFGGTRTELTDDERRDLGIPDGPFVLALATEEPRKNLDRVLDAFDLVKRDHPEVNLVLAGAKGHSSIFAHREHRAGDTTSAPIRLGYVADEVIPHLYASAATFVYAPLYEGFGIPPLEAAAAGTPSVLADVPPLRELDLTAAWVEPTDITSIAAGIDRQLTHPRRDPRSADAVLRDFSWDDSAEQLLTTLDDLGVTVA